MKVFLQKFVSQSSYCSRRKAEQLIRDGKIHVNGQPAELGMKVDEDDDIKIYGKKIALQTQKIYIILNKPKGYICTNRKFPGEKNVFELLKTENAVTIPGLSLRQSPRSLLESKLIIVGRLDKNSRGLVLLTNDGDLAQKLTHPRYENEKEYLVVTGQCPVTTNMVINKFKTGIDIGEGDGIARAKDVKYLGPSASSGQVKFKIILTEGKKRQIRRMFKVLGCEVTDIVRIRIGNLELNDLPEGKWRYLEKVEIKNLK